MAWYEGELVVCGQHPNEDPQPGICPSCLRERLSKIALAGNYYNNCNNLSSSLSSVYYNHPDGSGSSSGGPSPVNRGRRLDGRHHRVASDIMDSIYLAVSGSTRGLKKSRSMAFAIRDHHHHGDQHSHTKKKGGFWNKLLLRSTGKKAKF